VDKDADGRITEEEVKEVSNPTFIRSLGRRRRSQNSNVRVENCVHHASMIFFLKQGRSLDDLERMKYCSLLVTPLD
jgi:hypothetical protein